jgi:hypothetical protein
MDVSNLVKMANQIGQFFEIYPDRAAAEDPPGTRSTAS